MLNRQILHHPNPKFENSICPISWWNWSILSSSEKCCCFSTSRELLDQFLEGLQD
jgi:hypothetical protein